MADYPTPSEYQEALQAPDVAFSDPELQASTPRTNALGLPHPITGAFAAVFPVTTETGSRYAVKCFLTDVLQQQARYEAVAEALEGIEHEALIDFEYQPSGIRVAGDVYPLLKMEWAEGSTLNRFVEAHLDEPEVLARVADAWVALMADLETLELAHGDLQHGNVLVERIGDGVQLRLVDYDTMYVPALEGWSSPEVGHRNYQHPDRTEADFGPNLDRFAGLVIYTALRACAAHPDLWEAYDTGENLLFRDADFYRPEESPLFDDLQEREPVADLAEALQSACYLEPTEVPSLATVREEGVTLSLAQRAHSRVDREPENEARSPFARAALPVTAGVAVGAGALVLAGWPVAAIALLAVGIGGGVGLAAVRYRRLSLVRRQQRLQHEKERFTAAIREIRREEEALREKREALRTSMQEQFDERLREVQEEALHDQLKHHFVGEVQAVDGLTRKHVVRLKVADIRTASEATKEALESVRRISDEARMRLKRWRNDLEERYADEIPETLSPAQKRRVQRHVEHRIEDLDARLARARERVEALDVEHQRMKDRLAEMPQMTFGRYIRYLLRLAPFPEQSADTPPSPSPRQPEQEKQLPSVPDPAEENRPWWERTA